MAGLVVQISWGLIALLLAIGIQQNKFYSNISFHAGWFRCFLLALNVIGITKNRVKEKYFQTVGCVRC